MDPDTLPPPLRRRWDHLVEDVGVSRRRAEATLESLVERYAEPHRAYHTLEHVAAVLDTVAGLRAAGEPLDDPHAVELAAWFHDAVYDPRGTDNEAASARLARDALAGWPLPPPRVTSVSDLVLATRDHRAAAGTDAAVLVDADLAVLGADEDAYDAYARAIRVEYAFVPDADFRAGRARVLEGFLGRRRIFTTPTMATGAEEAARANLRRELGQLRRQDDRFRELP